LKRVLAILLAASLALAACGGQRRRSSRSTPQVTRGATLADTLLGLEEETFVYDSHDARDPFVPVWIGRRVPGRRGAARPTLSVSAIAWDAVAPTAIINDRFVREGDVIQGARVAKIGPSSVTMSYAGQTYTIRP
jgi:hypothetical protein